jgi:hypothetical protein
MDKTLACFHIEQFEHTIYKRQNAWSFLDVLDRQDENQVGRAKQNGSRRFNRPLSKTLERKRFIVHSLFRIYENLCVFREK